MARFLGAYPNPNRHFWWFIGPCEVTFDFVRLDQIPSGNQLHGLLENPPAIIVPWFYHPENLRIFHGEFPISARHGTVTPIQGGSLGVSEKTKNMWLRLRHSSSQYAKVGVNQPPMYPHVLLVGGWPTPLKNISQWEGLFHVWNGQIKTMFETTNQIKNNSRCEVAQKTILSR